MRIIISDIRPSRLILILMFFFIQNYYAQQNNHSVSSSAVWNPSMADMEGVKARCGLLKDEDLYQCLLSEMQSANASAEAIKFANLLGGKGYMKAFKEAGIIDIAYVYYPFDKDIQEGCILVNGYPKIIDADNYNLLDMDRLKETPEYLQFKNRYPHLSIFPGDRAGAHYPLVENLKNKGERIIINYALRDGCNHCQLIGYADFGFDFSSEGHFLGTKFLNLKKSAVNDSEVIRDGNSKNIFTDPANAIVVSLGEQFVIALRSNHSAGYKWELAEPLDGNLVNLTGSDYLSPYEILPNVPGKETWSFRAIGKGATVIKFKYVRNWQNGAREFQSVNFKLEVD